MGVRKYCLIALLVLLPAFMLHADEAGDAEPAVSQEPAAERTETEAAPPEAVPPQGIIKEVEALETEAAEELGFVGFMQKLGIAALIVAAQALLIWLSWQLFKKLNKKAEIYGGQKLKPLTIKKLHILSTNQMISTILFVLRILKYIITVFQLYLTLPLVFGLFPQTKNLSHTLFGYILNPLKNIFTSIISYIPNLITIIIILTVARYAMRALKFFATQIEKRKLVLPGFYPDWAQPTFNLLRVLLYAFTVVVIYPYLPGSGSPIFQGVSVFVGIIFSLGSSTAIGNLVAGMVITYMRPFKVGDRIKIQDVTGFIVEKSPIVTRIRTHKNEYVSFPNQMVLGSAITNYNISAGADQDGLILYADVTMGYNDPWRLIHELLINAALKTAYVLAEPKPYVLQTALDDDYVRYQINLYIKEVSKVPAIYSELFQHVQDDFKAAGLDLTSPKYRIMMPKP